MRLLPRLIDKAHELGYQVRGGDLFRDPRVHGELGEKVGYGNSSSCHKLKLAIDLNLFLNGAFYKTTESHRMIGDWWKKQWSSASEAAKSAKASLDTINVDELKKQASEITKSIESQNFTKVDELSTKLGKLLSVEKLSEGFRFVIIRRQRGGAAAMKAIEKYAAQPDLNDFEKTAAQNLKKDLAVIQSENLQGYIVLAIFFACECKLGAHQGGILAVPIISILFPDYLEKHGHTNL